MISDFLPLYTSPLVLRDLGKGGGFSCWKFHVEKTHLSQACEFGTQWIYSKKEQFCFCWFGRLIFFLMCVGWNISKSFFLWLNRAVHHTSFAWMIQIVLCLLFQIHVSFFSLKHVLNLRTQVLQIILRMDCQNVQWLLLAAEHLSKKFFEKM